MRIKKAFYYLFYKIYNFDKAISNDALNEWKPLVTILILELLLLIQTLNWYTLITKNRIDIQSPKLIIIPAIAFLFIWHYYYFLHDNKWRKYTQEFKQYDSKKKNFGGFIIVLLIVLIIIGMIYSFYHLRITDWAVPGCLNSK